MRTIKIDLRDAGFTFEGIGGITSNGMSKLLFDYEENIREEILDLLFKPGYGASLQHLKVEIGSDVNSSCGTEPSHMQSQEDFDITRGVGLEMAAAAKKRNPEIMLDALRWGTPRWIKDYDQKLLYYINFLKGAREKYGLEFDYIGPDINEGDFDPIWTTYVLRPGLDRNGFEKVKIIAADHDKDWRIADMAALCQPLRDSLDAMGIHYKSFSTEVAKSLGLPLWLSEDLAPYRHDFGAGVLEVAYRMLRMYPDGKMVKYELHPIVEAQYETTPFGWKSILVCNTPWSGAYEVTAGLWGVAHITHFVQPGYRYLDAGCCYDDASAVCTFLSPDEKDFSMVFVNRSTECKEYELHICSTLEGRKAEAFVTTEYRRMERDLDVIDGNTIKIPPNSIVTISTSGEEPITPKQPLKLSTVAFPLPLRYNFSEIPTHQPPYFLDQAGAFTLCGEGGERRLLQQLEKNQKPENWTYRSTPEPYSLFGATTLTNYSVRVKACFETQEENYILLAGRVNYCERDVSYPGGYYCRVFANGQWELNLGADTLAQGKIEGFDAAVLFSLQLDFTDCNISLYLNEMELTCVTNGQIPSGQAAIGSGYHKAEFYAIEIMEIEGYTPHCQQIGVVDDKIEFTGSWELLKGNYRHYFRHARKAGRGAVCRFTFTGTGFHILGQAEKRSGFIKAVVDGREYQDKNNVCLREGFRRSIFSLYGLDKGEHTVAIYFTEGRIFDSVEIVD